jgi:hypothetical protein
VTAHETAYPQKRLTHGHHGSGDGEPRGTSAASVRHPARAAVGTPPDGVTPHSPLCRAPSPTAWERADPTTQKDPTALRHDDCWVQESGMMVDSLLFAKASLQAHLRRSGYQCQALGEQGRNEQRSTDHNRSIPRRLTPNDFISVASVRRITRKLCPVQPDLRPPWLHLPPPTVALQSGVTEPKKVTPLRDLAHFLGPYKRFVSMRVLDLLCHAVYVVLYSEQLGSLLISDVNVKIYFYCHNDFHFVELISFEILN